MASLNIDEHSQILIDELNDEPFSESLFNPHQVVASMTPLIILPPLWWYIFP